MIIHCPYWFNQTSSAKEAMTDTPDNAAPLGHALAEQIEKLVRTEWDDYDPLHDSHYWLSIWRKKGVEAAQALRMKDADLKVAEELLSNLCTLADVAMMEANRDGGEYDRIEELASTRAFLKDTGK